MLPTLIETYILNRANWPEPNYINPQLAGNYLPAVQYILLALATICVYLRLFGRIALKSVGYDDLFIVIAWLFGLVVTIANFLTLNVGFGRHVWDFAPNMDNSRTLLLNTWLSQWAAGISNMAAKLSILFFYRRFAPTRTFKLLVVLMTWFVLVWGIATTVPWILRCTPVSAWWEIAQPGRCMTVAGTEVLMYVQLALNLFSDFVLFVMPIQTLWQLQISTKRKALLVSCLGVGLLCTGFGAMRLQMVSKASGLDDPTWDGYEVLLWGILETQLGIVCACLPFMKTSTIALYNFIFRRTGKPLTSPGISTVGKGDPDETFATHTFVDGDIRVTRTWDVEKTVLSSGSAGDRSSCKYTGGAYLTRTTTTTTTAGTVPIRGHYVVGMALAAPSQESLSSASEITEPEGDNWWENEGRATSSLGGGLSPRRETLPRPVDPAHIREGKVLLS